eukprot:ANDGO_07693.mRNA.1 hypothetical protein
MVVLNWTTQSTAEEVDLFVVDPFTTQQINVATSGETIVYTHYRIENDSGDDAWKEDRILEKMAELGRAEATA